ncbi:MAG: hypothetical protein AAF560_08395 [Acidobacteriota bacterium]
MFVPVLMLTVACGSETPPEAIPEPPEEAEVESPLCEVWQVVDSGISASFRGLSVVGDGEVVWVSGTGGTWGRTVDRGATWTSGVVPDAEDLDFRDVDAFSQDIAYLMSAGPGELSRIYKTVDGGGTWELQLTNPGPEGFFDGMAFWGERHGLVYGDPVDGRFMVLATDDGGSSWNSVPSEGMPPALDGEAGFAASGTGLAVMTGGLAWFGTGGPEARVFRSRDYGQSWQVATTPMLAGEGSMGIFSVAFSDPSHGIAVGGDYTQPEGTERHAACTTDGGVTWTLIESSSPAGYRSAVAFVPDSQGQIVMAAGTSGSDLSLDGGESWQTAGAENTNCVAFGPSLCTGWAAGPEGFIAKLVPATP